MRRGSLHLISLKPSYLIRLFFYLPWYGFYEQVFYLIFRAFAGLLKRITQCINMKWLF